MLGKRFKQSDQSVHLRCRHQGFLNFPSSACYVPLKSLAVGTLCKLCRTEPDVATLAMHLSLAPVLLEAVYDGTSTVYLKVRATRLSSTSRVAVGYLDFTERGVVNNFIFVSLR